jgi:hypothetical protein
MAISGYGYRLPYVSSGTQMTITSDLAFHRFTPSSYYVISRTSGIGVSGTYNPAATARMLSIVLMYESEDMPVFVDPVGTSPCGSNPPQMSPCP